MGYTPLHSATDNGHTECVKLLLAHPDIQVDAQDSTDETALIKACRKNNTDIAKVLLMKGADVNLKNNNGMTALHRAAKCGDDEQMEKLLNILSINVNVQDENGWTPLHFAAYTGHIECVNILLNAQGIDVNINNNSYRTPLALTQSHWSENKQKIIHVLKQHGATY